MGRQRGKLKHLAATSLLCSILALMLVSIPLGTVYGDTLSDKQEQAKQAKAQLQANQAELNRLTAALNQTESQLASVEASIDRNQQELDVAEAELSRFKGILNQRVKAMYMEGNASSLEVMLDSTSFDEFLNSYDYMRMIGDYDTDMVQSTRNLMGEIAVKRASLENSKAQYQTQAASQASQRSAIQAKLAEQQSIIASLDSDISAMVSQQVSSSRNSGSGGGGGGYWDVGPVNGLYFPVAGPHSFTNDWGAPRSVGRTHKGTDVMANYGVPCVAITSGRVEQRSGGNAGYYVALFGDNGNLYYYMHLQSFAATGHVGAGTVIGYVGDTGNARGCPHLHFEFHPGGGGPVNPYPLLKAID
jgi:peptidoglycan hydrolase CwlO-like protein